ncbi:Hypothetical predicted protein [Paramuricea clavata]|uniref:Mutator-like transposase domain-containing protein n=1 Tax=Paramuricea clavata TaxID=317549 RepID=A0A6S7GTA0_PARCT|nr:Hypothetical predicted protein [Paramuricea clavata]
MRNDPTMSSGNHDSSHVSNEIPMPISSPADGSISSKKLLNSSFEKFESKSGRLTRKQARKVGLGSIPDIETAKGFKLQDAILLNDCISKPAICSSCRKPNSKLGLYQNNSTREGKAHSSCDHESVNYKEWKKAHKKNCEINHHGSSEEMEAVSAVDIFSSLSIETRNLKYTTCVGDGDSSSFGRVKEALEKKYYGKAIRGNKGDLEGLKKSIKAIQHHMIKNDKESLKKQHEYWPMSADTWCKYWKVKNDHTNLYNEDASLSVVFMAELYPIFTRLSKDTC